MKESEKLLIKKFTQKSKDAFYLAIEIYNKPVGNYKLEAFVILLINAWELLLKAKIIETFGEDSIYYENKKDRTISCSDALKKLITDQKEKIRKNIELILELRRKSVHYYVKEIDALFNIIFQENVKFYVEKMEEYFDIDITQEINPSLIISTDISSIDLKNLDKEYSKDIIDNLLSSKQEIENYLKGSINIVAKISSTKDSDIKVTYDKNAKTSLKVIKEIPNINFQYPYTQKTAIQEVIKHFQKKNISIIFHQAKLTNLNRQYKLKDNDEFYYKVELNKNNSFKCSQKLVNFLIQHITKNIDEYIRKD